MDEARLSAEDERQIGQALAGAPDDLKQKFCGCWPSVKGLLEWLSGRVGGLLKALLTILISLGDGVYKALECGKTDEPQG